MLLLTQPVYSFGQVSNHNKPCRTEVDSLTKQLVYVAADVEPKNEGGDAALRKKIEKNIITDLTIDTENYESKVIVAFIVDTDGSIKGCRVIKDKTNKVGQQMLDIVKSFKWTPAKCDNKNVAMIYQIPLILDPEEQ
jgi:hypothetical protein